MAEDNPPFDKAEVTLCPSEVPIPLHSDDFRRSKKARGTRESLRSLGSPREGVSEEGLEPGEITEEPVLGGGAC